MGHIPVYWSELADKFLNILNHHIRVVVTGKRVNRGIGLGLEMALDYFFDGDSRVIECFKKTIELFNKCTDVKVENFFKITHFFCYCFLIYKKLVCPL